MDIAEVDDKSLVDLASSYEKIVIWGRNKWHSHYWVTCGYYNALNDLKIPCAWLEDRDDSISSVGPKDFLIFNAYDSKYLTKLNPKAFLAFTHELTGEVICHMEKIPGVYHRQQQLSFPIGDGLGCNGQVYYCKKSRLLQQPWGTDLLASDFRDPCFSEAKRVFWAGQIWRQKESIKSPEWGNIPEMETMKSSLLNRGIKMIQMLEAYRDINIGFIRASRIAPSVQGYGQVQVKHLACRFFKNISYGQFCVSNNLAAKDLLGSSCVYAESIEELVDLALQVKQEDAKEMCREAQKIISKFTIAAGLARTLKIISDS